MMHVPKQNGVYLDPHGQRVRFLALEPPRPWEPVGSTALVELNVKGTWQRGRIFRTWFNRSDVRLEGGKRDEREQENVKPQARASNTEEDDANAQLRNVPSVNEHREPSRERRLEPGSNRGSESFDRQSDPSPQRNRSSRSRSGHVEPHSRAGQARGGDAETQGALGEWYWIETRPSGFRLRCDAPGCEHRGMTRQTRGQVIKRDYYRHDLDHQRENNE